MKGKFSLRNIKISQRTFLAFLIMNCAIILIFIIFLFLVNKLNTISHQIIDDNVASIRAAYNVEVSALSLKGTKASYILDRESHWLDEFNRNVTDFNDWYDRAVISAKTQTEKDILAELDNHFGDYLKIHKQILDLLNKDRRNEAVSLLFNDSNDLFRQIYDECELLIAENDALINVQLQKVKFYLFQGQIIGYIIVAGFIILGIFLSILLANSITIPIKQLTRLSENALEDKFPPYTENHIQDIGSGQTANIHDEENLDEIQHFKTRFDDVIKSLDEKQQMLIQAERKAAVGEMTAGISHELNNPIGIIYGFAERMLKKEQLNPSDKIMVEKIFSEADRCRLLLREFLDFAKPGQLHLSRVNLNELIREAVDSFTPQEKYRDILFSLSVPEEFCFIQADSSRLNQVLLNLILNGIDAVHDTADKKISVTLSRNNDHFLIIVRDTGTGIRPENREQIFKPFFSTKPRGTGLGLSISRDIIERHNGKLLIESECEQWTEFRILLPAKNRNQAAR